VTAPNNYEISSLKNDYAVDLDLLNDILDIDEQSRSEKEDDRLVFILRIPVFHEEREIPYFTLPLGVIFAGDMIITICLQDNDIIRDFIENKVKNFSLINRKTFLLSIFFRSSLYFLRYLKEINRKTAHVEKELQRAIKNNELIQLLTIEKSLVFFTTSLKSNEFLMDKIQKSNLIKLSEEDVELIEDVVTENRQAIEMANIYSNILSGMMDAFASVISNNLNVVLKQLTSISLILMIPTLIASVYGMNVDLPFQKNPFAFLGTLGVSVVLALISIFIFRRKKFF
jgi:magnesium transporter